MRRVPGFAVEWVDRGCCGMGGTFGLKRHSFGMFMEIGRSLFQAIGEAKPDRVITDCTSCRVQIEQGTGLCVKGHAHFKSGGRHLFRPDIQEILEK